MVSDAQKRGEIRRGRGRIHIWMSMEVINMILSVSTIVLNSSQTREAMVEVIDIDLEGVLSYPHQNFTNFTLISGRLFPDFGE